MPDFDLDRAVRLATRAAIKEVAKQLTEELHEKYVNVITKFYEDYPKPVLYKRTYSTYKATDYDMQGESLAGPSAEKVPGYVGGINVDAYYIWHHVGGSPYRQPASYVFERTFAKGIHGFTNKEAKSMVRSGKNVFGDRISIKIKPPKAPMRPTPKRLMDKEFREIRKRDHIDPMVNAALTKYLNKYLA